MGRCRIAVALAVFALLRGGALAQGAPDGRLATFTDPTEGAFTVEAPQGWRLAGGVKRFAPADAPPWVTAVSPDGRTELFLGDPSVPMFQLPNPAMGMQEGSPAPGLTRPLFVMRYQPGAEFAATYGTRSLASVCSNVQLQGTQPLPALLDDMKGHVMVPAQGNNRLDAGLATFTCQSDGQPVSAGVAAGTYLFDPAGNGGNWQAIALFGFRTPPGNETEAFRTLLQMRQSLKFKPEWLAAMQRASDEQGEQVRRRGEALAQRPAPAPIIQPRPQPGYEPRLSAAPRCDDLQQRRICNINDGHLVSSGGCLVCVSP